MVPYPREEVYARSESQNTQTTKSDAVPRLLEEVETRSRSPGTQPGEPGREIVRRRLLFDNLHEPYGIEDWEAYKGWCSARAVACSLDTPEFPEWYYFFALLKSQRDRGFQYGPDLDDDLSANEEPPWQVPRGKYAKHAPAFLDLRDRRIARKEAWADGRASAKRVTAHWELKVRLTRSCFQGSRGPPLKPMFGFFEMHCSAHVDHCFDLDAYPEMYVFFTPP